MITPEMLQDLLHGLDDGSIDIYRDAEGLTHFRYTDDEEPTSEHD